MAIQLPPQLAGVSLPAQPHHPPTLQDVAAAQSYQARVDVAVASQDPHAPTEIDAAQAEIYKTSIVLAHANIAVEPLWSVEPPWFESAMRHALTHALDHALAPALAPMQITLAQTRNHQLNDGSFSQFAIVPFNDGSDPTQAPHNLPALINVAAIRQLSEAQSTAYVVGYGLENATQVHTRQVAIGRAVGCTVNI